MPAMSSKPAAASSGVAASSGGDAATTVTPRMTKQISLCHHVQLS